jgi:hypothetical protein
MWVTKPVSNTITTTTTTSSSSSYYYYYYYCYIDERVSHPTWLGKPKPQRDRVCRLYYTHTNTKTLDKQTHTQTDSQAGSVSESPDE